MRLETEPIVYRDGDVRLEGVLAIDADRAGRRPGILVVHGGGGVDDHARGRARRFAEAGFVVFACDMYGEGVTGNRERIIRHIGELRANRGAIVLFDGRFDRLFAAGGQCQKHQHQSARAQVTQDHAFPIGLRAGKSPALTSMPGTAWSRIDCSHRVVSSNRGRSTPVSIPIRCSM